MELLIGSVLTVALVLLLIAAITTPLRGDLRDFRVAAHMLLLGVPAVVLQTDLVGIAVLAGSSMALYELVLIAFAI